MWIARDMNGDLGLYLCKPLRKEVRPDGWWELNFSEPKYEKILPGFMALPKELYPEVTWETEPLEVKLEKVL